MEGEENLFKHLLLENDDDLAEEIKNITGYEFKDQHLLVQAFTHHSYVENCESSYERLEYVGDSVLNLMVAEEHYLLYPDLQPGDLTRLRAANVDTEKLARAALKHQLHKFLRHNKPILAGQIKEFEEAVVKYPLHSWGLIDVPKALADIVESFIGAIYIDSNRSKDLTNKVQIRISNSQQNLHAIALQIAKDLLRPMITPESIQMHPVTMLYEICQNKGWKVHIKDMWSKKTGEIQVFVDGKFAGEGRYEGKKFIAVNRAAHDANQQIVRRLAQENTQCTSSPSCHL
ncbi:ribonuclease 3-like protein 3 [Olea europaea var. sylvestris]|uniref:ribonuclease 3-like protein 3 n=1 Tax=Olea europaea var. sylvestris TaxID=158386 RepID=UPI000C1D7C4C|nr:ribonuclease 3-like protein 3 [Olea europaea var. sylvestris]